MNIKSFFKNNWIHFVVLSAFLIITLAYFSPQFKGQSIEQGDVTQYIGASNEAYWFKDKTGEEQLWTNSMFGGMPTTQISLVHPGNFIGRAIMNFVNWFPAPAGMVFLHLLCFYIMLLCFKVNRWVAIIGAIAFAFATYEIVILGAGHNSKSLAVAFMAPVVGGLYLAYRSKLWLGIGLSSLFMALEVSCNHLQVTYYLGILLLGIGINEAIRAFRQKELRTFFIASSGLVIAYGLALAVNYGNISLTNEYAKETIRGGNDITITPEGELSANSTKGGLDKDYITTWSYGVGESFTLISPYVKGGATKAFIETPHAKFVEDAELRSDERKMIQDYPVYWGEQPGTAGPVYVGVIMIFLALLGLIFLKDPIKWPLFVVGVIALMLSWGKNFMGFTDFWLDNVPGYNKFRTVTIILVIIELIVPLIAVLFLDRLIKQRSKLTEQKKKFLYSSLGFIVFLVLVKIVGLNDNYVSKQFDIAQLDRIESSILQQISKADPLQLQAQYNLDVNNPIQLSQFVDSQMEVYEDNLNNVKELRSQVFHSSMNRSILFALLAFGALAAIFFTSMNIALGVGLIGVLSVIDLMGVSTNYLSNDEKYWIDALDKKYPFSPQSADEQILQLETMSSPELKSKINKVESAMKKELADADFDSRIKRRMIDKERFAVLNANTNYRVFDYTGGFNSAKASYYHKSLGGYHGAKLRSIQNVFEFHISNSNNAVFDMLNVKYFFQQEQGKPDLILRQNPNSLGNAWFVKEIEIVEDRNEEIARLGKLFQVENKGEGSLLINGKNNGKSEIRGFERVQYVLSTGDTLDVPLSNGLTKGLKALFVMDVNGETNLVPESTILADTSDSFIELVSLEVIREFNPSQKALIAEENKNGIKNLKFSGQGTISMNEYSPMKITYSSESNENQFAVFSEMYYEQGWRALIDGKEAEIINVNYCIRGLEVPKGKHKIQFYYDTSPYEKSNKISLFLCFLVLIFTGFSIWKQKRADQLSSASSGGEREQVGIDS